MLSQGGRNRGEVVGEERSHVVWGGRNRGIVVIFCIHLCPSPPPANKLSTLDDEFLLFKISVVVINEC